MHCQSESVHLLLQLVHVLQQARASYPMLDLTIDVLMMRNAVLIHFPAFQENAVIKVSVVSGTLKTVGGGCSMMTKMIP